MADFASKTAKASIKAGQMTQKEEPVLSDAELVRLLRIDRQSHLWPGTQMIDALLREYNGALLANAELSNQIRKLADFIIANVPGEPFENESAIDCAIRLIGNSIRGGV